MGRLEKSARGDTKRWVAVLVGSLIALVTSSARAQPRMPTHVACVGDSITQGVGASSSASNYPTRLQGLLGPGTVVRNFGHSGATLLTTGDLPYQRQGEYMTATTFVTNAGPDAVVDVIIMLGTNDSKPGNWSPGDGGSRAPQYATDLAALVDHFTGLPTHPVVYLALPLDALANSFTISGRVIRDEIIPVIMQVATDKAAPTIDLNTPTAGRTEYFVDGVHPNDGGYGVVAGLMRDGLLRVPQVMLTSPMAGASVAAPEVGVTAEATAGATVVISSVEFFAAADPIGAVTTSPFTLAWSPAAPGSYALSAKATDSTGAAATSEPVAVTVIAAGGGTGGNGAAPGGGASGCGCRIGVSSAVDSVALASGPPLAIGILVWRRRRRPEPGTGSEQDRAGQPLK